MLTYADECWRMLAYALLLQGLLSECREHVRKHGGPDIEALGWVCKIGAADSKAGNDAGRWIFFYFFSYCR
jgi:hypothetical protein